MDSSAPQQSFQDIITANKFPAKLWNMVNDPANDAIFWDSRGELVIINRCLLEKEVLLKSFHRKLNLYGFMKIRSRAIEGRLLFFRNPNFKREHPEILHKMTRKPVNRAKAVANQRKTQQLPDQNHQGGKSNTTTCSSDQPYNPSISQPIVLSGTPVPQVYMMSMDLSAAQLPQFILADEEMPVDYIHPSGFAESTTTFNSSPSLMTSHGNPNQTISQPAVQCHHGQYLPVPHQQHLEYSTQVFSHPDFYQSTQFLIPSELEESTQVLTPGETSELMLDDSDMDFLLKIAHELLQDSTELTANQISRSGQ